MSRIPVDTLEYFKDVYIAYSVQLVHSTYRQKVH